ncbi:MAG: FtsX-like permease family protein [bacterium]|nr:FtsX-like permease family protein [bacterium]
MKKIKNRLKTNSYRNIKKSLPRFFSLLIMSFLGVFVYAGLQATSPDMLNSLDNYFDEYNTYDVKIISTLGLTNNDINSLKKISNVKDVEGINSVDSLIKINKKDLVINVTSLPKNINKLKILSGRLPSKENEIVIEENMLKENNLQLGDTINLDNSSFNNEKAKIVGTVESTLYLNNVNNSPGRGSTNIGTGKIDYYTYMLKDNFDQDYLTGIYLTVKDAKNEITSSDKYDVLVNDVSKRIESIKKTQEEKRYKELYNDTSLEIINKENEYLEELAKVKAELDANKEKLDKANEELVQANDKLTPAKNELDQANSKLIEAKASLDTWKASLDQAKSSLETGKNNYQNTLNQYGLTEDNLQQNINDLKEYISQIELILEKVEKDSSLYRFYSEKLTTLKSQLESLEQIKSTGILLKNKEQEYNNNLVSYNNAYSSYSTSLNEYRNNLQKYNNSYNTYQENLNSYNSKLEEYNKALKEYEDNEKKLKDEIAKANEILDTIAYPVWYIYDRYDNSTYSDYIDDTNSLGNLSKLFPAIFFAVAILISLISMNRMVEEDRTEIGTLKSLGFENKHIRQKYVIFASIATIIGGLLGATLGLVIIPNLISNIYKVLFTLPKLELDLNLVTTSISFFLILICITGTSILTVNKVLKEKPADLMRPKAPKNGKRILLEKVKFIWNNINFSRKITIRNIARYKKRVIITVTGIAGCTVLILTGFGIRDSITDIPKGTFDDTFNYDVLVYVNNQKKINDEAFENDLIKNFVKLKAVSATVKDTSANLIISNNNEELSKFINLIDVKTKEKVSLKTDEAIITDKLSEVTGLKQGDEIEILDADNNVYNLKITAVVQMYFQHYIFINKDTYDKVNKRYRPNLVSLQTKKLSEKQEQILTKELLTNSEVLNVVYKRASKAAATNRLKSLNSVVVILIVLASMLSFVVLYNLSNININERKREIATLKVLGFYNNEVDNYITKENIILTIIGIALGLVLGYFLTNAVVSTVEVESARFIHQIKVASYIYSAILSIMFTVIVNIITHFNLKKIDMIESLKSVE